MSGATFFWFPDVASIHARWMASGLRLTWPSTLARPGGGESGNQFDNAPIHTSSLASDGWMTGGLQRTLPSTLARPGGGESGNQIDGASIYAR